MIPEMVETFVRGFLIGVGLVVILRMVIHLAN